MILQVISNHLVEIGYEIRIPALGPYNHLRSIAVYLLEVRCGDIIAANGYIRCEGACFSPLVLSTSDPSMLDALTERMAELGRFWVAPILYKHADPEDTNLVRARQILGARDESAVFQKHANHLCDSRPSP